MKKSSILFLLLFIVGISYSFAGPGREVDRSTNRKGEQFQREAVSLPQASDAVEQPGQVVEEAQQGTITGPQTLQKEAPSKREMRRSVKKELKTLKPSQNQDGSDNKALLIIIAILIPWVAVGMFAGWGSTEFIIDLILWLLFYLPGLVYALWVILR